MDLDAPRQSHEPGGVTVFRFSASPLRGLIAVSALKPHAEARGLQSLRLRRGRRAAPGTERFFTGPFEGPPSITAVQDIGSIESAPLLIKALGQG